MIVNRVLSQQEIDYLYNKSENEEFWDKRPNFLRRIINKIYFWFCHSTTFWTKIGDGQWHFICCEYLDNKQYLVVDGKKWLKQYIGNING